MSRLLWTQKQDIGPPPRSNHGMVYDEARKVTVLFGGFNGTGKLNDTWIWDGQNWSQVADTGPQPRHGIRLAYDKVRQRVVLFGGALEGPTADPITDRFLADTWEWDGSFWTQVADSGPSARMLTGVTYDTVRQRVLLYGGMAPGGNGSGDTWEWDGTEWTQVEDVGPGNRQGHVLAYDEVREKAVLYGGGPTLSILNPPQDTWEWDGHTWTHRTNIGPGPCIWHSMTYSGSSVTLYGGVNLSVDLSAATRNTWQWDGTRWTLRQDMGPGPRLLHAITYDSQRNQIVLFGGQATFGMVNGGQGDTWEAVDQ